MKPLRELIAGSMYQKQSRFCWYIALDARGKEFVNEVCRLADDGEPIVVARVTAILRDEFGVKNGLTVVRKHIRGECQCPRAKVRPKVSPKKR